MNEMKIGVVGAGIIGRYHIKNIQEKVPGLSISGVYSPNLDINWVKQQGIPQGTRDFNDILANKNIHGIAIFSATKFHANLIKESIEAGKKYIFCEKPVSTDLDELKKLHQLAQEQDCRVMVGYNRRFDEGLQEIAQERKAGTLGEVQRISIYNMDGQRPRISFLKHSGGFFYDMVIHDFDSVRFLSGAEVTEVTAIGDILIEPGLRDFDDVDTASIMMRLSNNGHAMIQGSRENSAGYYQEYKVFGSKENREVSNFGQSRVKRMTRQGTSINEPFPLYAGRYASSLVNEFIAFSKVCNQASSVPIGLEDCIKAVEIAKAAYLSHKQSRTVSIAEVAE